MINKYKEEYKWSILIKNIEILFYVINYIDYNEVYVNIPFNKDWYNNYDYLFNTKDWARDFIELQQSIVKDIVFQNNINKDRVFSSHDINENNIQFNITNF